MLKTRVAKVDRLIAVMTLVERHCSDYSEALAVAAAAVEAAQQLVLVEAEGSSGGVV